MYHLRMKGDHYHAGYQFGKRLKDHDIYIMNIVPFELSQLRIEFANQCANIYKEYYPEIVEEIKGICDGQGIEYQQLSTVLYSMYCIMPDQKCSCFIMNTKNEYLLGRNSDFLTEIEKACINAIYRLDGCYSFIGNTTAFVEMEDGMNEHGLAIGLTSVYPKEIKPGLNAGMLLRYMLEKCKNVQDAIVVLKQLPIASSQTFTLVDNLGDSAVIECDCQNIEIIIDKQIAVNAFYSDKMKMKRNLTIDDWNASERYQTMEKALKVKVYSLEIAQDILSGKYGFICQYNRKTGKDTVWSVVYDAKNKRVYRCEGNPSRKKFIEDKRI